VTAALPGRFLTAEWRDLVMLNYDTVARVVYNEQYWICALKQPAPTHPDSASLPRTSYPNP